MHFSTFTHAKCRRCGRFGKLDSFEVKNEVIGVSDCGNMSIEQLVIKCPLCGDDHCEGVFQDEIN